MKSLKEIRQLSQLKSQKKRIINDLLFSKKILRIKDIDKIIIWIAGIISTDGSIDKNGYMTIVSAEKNWLEKIEKKLKKIGLKGHCCIYYYQNLRNKGLKGYYRLRLKKPLVWYFLLREYKDFLMDRKFENLENHALFLKEKYKSQKLKKDCNLEESWGKTAETFEKEVLA
jgi:hypothetical protein